MELLRKISSWKTFIVLQIIYVFFVVFVMSAMTGGEGTKHQPLDLLFSYTPDQAYALITSYGETRLHYAFMSMTADTLYPVIYTLCFMVLILQLAKHLWPNRQKLHRIALIPLLTFAFDLLENFHIITMLKAYPDRLDGTARLASLFTSLKWSCVGLTIILIFGLLILLLVKNIRKRS